MCVWRNSRYGTPYSLGSLKGEYAFGNGKMCFTRSRKCQNKGNGDRMKSLKLSRSYLILAKDWEYGLKEKFWIYMYMYNAYITNKWQWCNGLVKRYSKMLINNLLSYNILPPLLAILVYEWAWSLNIISTSCILILTILKGLQSFCIQLQIYSYFILQRSRETLWMQPETITHVAIKDVFKRGTPHYVTWHTSVTIIFPRA